MSRRIDEDISQKTERLAQSGELGTVLSVAEAHLTIVEGVGAGLEVPCGSRPVKIGSAPDNDLVIADTAVSRHHAVLEPSGGQLLLRDLESTNGTYLQNVKVREAFAQPECLIRVGKSTLRLHVKPRRVFVPPSRADRFGALAGKGLKMRQVFGILEWVAPTEATVLFMGGTGTGKEVAARSVHESSPRRKGPFVVLDCGAVDRGLVSSELFGHEVGAFTGATTRRAGIFEQAKGGTVFIDEVGELPLDLQPKLLRALEAREVRRLGATTSTPLDVRVLAATNRDLAAMVTRKEFREDLYYRLSQVKVVLPTLDERREDIPLLVESFLSRIGPRTQARSLSTEVLAFLGQTAFPGNVRQLWNLIERAAMVARGPRIEMADILVFGEELLPSTPAGRPAATPGTGAGHGPEGARPLSEVERDAIVLSLRAHQYNLSRTARALGIAVNTLKARMHRYGIPRPGRPEDTDTSEG